MCRRWALADAGELFCPAEHRAAAERVYAALGAAARFTDAVPGSVRAESELEEEYDARHRGRVLIVRAAGEDLPKRLAALPADDAAAVCYLNLKSPGAERSYAALCEAGFKPLGPGEEYMLLARVSGEWRDTLHLTPGGRWLADYMEL